MNAFEGIEPARVAIVGDLHANIHHTRDVITYAAANGADAILQVGDIVYDMRDDYHGRPSYIDQVSEAATDAGVPFAFVDGNHDRHDKLQALAAEHDWTAVPVRPGFYYLPRGYRWTWNEVRFLALGGAHSVDRPWRRAYIEWWPGETIGAADALRACDGGVADVMICHDVPDGIPIPWIAGNPFGFPERELAAAQRNREVLRRVVDVVRPGRLFAGHYHGRLHTELVGDGYRTEVDVLDMDGRPLTDNVAWLDLLDYPVDN